MAGKDPIISGMAGRYANALFELALENKAVDAVKADLDRFDALIADNPDLNRLVRSPVFDADSQLRALAAILAERMALYEQAHLTIDTDGATIEEVAALVASALEGTQ